jgi:predicted metal-dependent HD superfamily phosphohydrolase
MESNFDLIPPGLQHQWLVDIATLGCANVSGSAHSAQSAQSVEVLEGIVARYAEPHRHYHSVSHVVHVLKAADDLLLAEGVDLHSTMSRTIRLALWYHDAIYDVRSNSNEQDSAVLAESELTLLEIPAHVRTDVTRLIMVTKYPTVPKAPDEAIVHDADLVILRAPIDIYRRYVDQVRAEYSFVSDDDWAIGRHRVMQGFLNADRIFHTRTAAAEEHIARANIASEFA